MLSNDFQKLGVTGLITLYQLVQQCRCQVLFWMHNDGDMSGKAKTYHAIIITAVGLEMRGDGKASTPTLYLTMSFNGIVGGLSVVLV